jgi:hypothetical protein
MEKAMNSNRHGASRGKLALAITSLALALAGCGGGGGDNSNRLVEVPAGARSVAASTGSDVNADRLATLGGWLARAVLSASGNGALNIAAARENAQALPARLPSARSAAFVHARALRAALQRGAEQMAARESTAAIRTEVQPCLNGGSLSVTGNDADDNNQLNAGDSVTAVFTNCVLDNGLPATSGTLQLTVNAVELDSNGDVNALDASVNVSNFNVVGYGSFTGAMRLWSKLEAGGDRTRVSYRATSVTYATTNLVFDFDIYGIGDTNTNFDLNGGIGIDSQTYALLGGDVFSAVEGSPPSIGSMRLVDAAGDAIRLTARSASTFDLEFIPAGGGAATATLPGLNWADYLGPPQ